MSDKIQANDDVQVRWFKPVNRLGQASEVFAMIASFGPFLYLYLTYGQLPPLATIGTGLIGVAAAYGAAWFVEPISYFPALGTAGTYMGILAGSIGQMRVPAALVAKSVAGVEENTQEAEIVATCGIAGSVYMNTLIIFLTAVGGAVILEYLPGVVMKAMSAYVLPCIFGAVLAMFTGKNRLQLTLPVIIIAMLMNWGVGKMLTPPIPAIILMGVMIVVIASGVGVAYVEYKMKWVE